VESYYHDLYGPAAPEMLLFRAEMLRRFVDPGPCVHHYDLSYMARATHELLLPALEHLGRARALAAADEDKRYWQAVERTQVGVDWLLRMGQWQRLLRDMKQAEGPKRQVLTDRARRAGEELITWAREHADTGSILAPRIAHVVGAVLAGLGG